MCSVLVPVSICKGQECKKDFIWLHCPKTGNTVIRNRNRKKTESSLSDSTLNSGLLRLKGQFSFRFTLLAEVNSTKQHNFHLSVLIFAWAVSSNSYIKEVISSAWAGKSVIAWEPDQEWSCGLNTRYTSQSASGSNIKVRLFRSAQQNAFSLCSEASRSFSLRSITSGFLANHCNNSVDVCQFLTGLALCLWRQARFWWKQHPAVLRQERAAWDLGHCDRPNLKEVSLQTIVRPVLWNLLIQIRQTTCLDAEAQNFFCFIFKLKRAQAKTQASLIKTTAFISGCTRVLHVETPRARPSQC